MQLIDLIPDLLFKHNCVIIPEFGGFVANFKSARYNEERLLASPAIKRIAFNQSLTENDGLLIKELSRVNDISYSDAEKEVSNFVKFLKGRLDQYNNYEFKNIGSFYLNKEGKIVFVAYEGLNFYPNSYGLGDVKVKRLERSIDEQRITERQIRKPEVHNPALDNERSIPWRSIAAVLVVIVAFSFMIWQIAGNESEADIAMVEKDTHNVASVVDPLVVEDSFAEDEITEDSSPDQTFIGEVHSEEEASSQEIHSDLQESSINEEFDQNTIDFADETKYQEESPSDIQVADTEPDDYPEDIEEAVRETDALPLTLSELRAMRQAHFGQEHVFYVVVRKSTDASEIDHVLQNFRNRSFEAFVIDGMKKGEKAVCLERFYDRQNADEYLRLIRNYEHINADIMQVVE